MTCQCRNSTRSSVSAYILLALTTATSVHAADLYRWQDEEGKTHYTDQVPPKYIEKGYRVISEQGLTIRTIKSTDEIEQSKSNEPSTPKISKKQAYQDQRLLMTYSHEDEILSTRSRKLDDVRTMMSLTQETITLLEAQYRQLAKEAGDLEKQGKTIPDSLMNQISATKRKIEKHQSRLIQGTDYIEKINQEFDEKLQRYRELKNAMNEIE